MFMKQFNNLCYFIFLFFVTVGLSACNNKSSKNSSFDETVPAYTLNEGSAKYATGDESQKNIFIINTEAEYNQVLKKFSSFNEMSIDNFKKSKSANIDFANNQVIIIALGLRNTVETITLDSVTENGTRNLVKVTYNFLAPDSNATQAGYYPAIKVIIENKKPTVIEEKTVLK